MNRYIAFLDILGFADLVQKESLVQVKQRLMLAQQSLALAKSGGGYPKPPPKNTKPVHYFSFSDTFVLASADDSLEALISFIIESALTAQYLFAQGLPVRGAITYGEADFIPGTNHLVGKAIIAAHALEMRQEWLGVIVDVGSLPTGALAAFELPALAPLFARWDVPIKAASSKTRSQLWDCSLLSWAKHFQKKTPPCVLKNALVLNWRLNLTIEKGTRSLFHHSEDKRAQQKVTNTLAFIKHICMTKRHVGYPVDTNGKPMRIPFLAGCNVGTTEPGKGLVHGDDL